MQEGGGLGAGSDLVAVWEVGLPGFFRFFLEIFLNILSFCWDILHLTSDQVHLADGIHVIEFEHGTTSGSRVLRVDREVTSFENWETFRIN